MEEGRTGFGHTDIITPFIRLGKLKLRDTEAEMQEGIGEIIFEKPAEVIAGGYYTTEIYTNEISDGAYVVNLVTNKETLSFKTMKY